MRNGNSAKRKSFKKTGIGKSAKTKNAIMEKRPNLKKGRKVKYGKLASKKNILDFGKLALKWPKN